MAPMLLDFKKLTTHPNNKKGPRRSAQKSCVQQTVHTITIVRTYTQTPFAPGEYSS